MKPIAIDLGRNYWVMARMDAYGQPEVASVGEGGQIPAVISEYNGELLLGQRVSEEGGLPPLQDFFRLLADDPETMRPLQGRVRDNGAGETELFLGNEWRTTSGLLTHMLHYLVPLVREPGTEGQDVPVVVAIPPGLTPKVLYLLRKAVDESGFQLLTWCTIPQAMVYCDPQLSQMNDLLVLTMHVEAGSLGLGLIQIERGFPVLIHHKSLDWAHEFPLPVGQVGPLLSGFLQELENEFHIHPSQIDRILMGGESSWLTHLQGVASEVLNCEHVPFHRPQFSVAMGASILAGWMQEGLLLTPPPEVTSESELVLRGFTTPGTRLYLQSSMEQYDLEIGLDGLLEAHVSLVPNQDNDLEVTLERADGQRFAYRMNVTQQGGLSMSGEATVEGDVEEHLEISTQPDLEVPEEMLQGGSEFGIPSSPAVEEALLDEEGEEITSGEGGIETRIVSRETLLNGDFSDEEREAVRDVLSGHLGDDDYDVITTGQFEGLLEEQTGQFDDDDVVEALSADIVEEEIVEADMEDILEEVSLDEYEYAADLDTGEKTPPQEMQAVGYISNTDDALQAAEDMEMVEVQDVDDLDVIEVTDDVVEIVDETSEISEEELLEASQELSESQVVLEVMDLDSADHSGLLNDVPVESVSDEISLEESAEVNLEEVTLDPILTEEDAAQLRSTSPSSPPVSDVEEEYSLRDTSSPSISLRDTAVPQLEEDDEMAFLRAEMASMPLQPNAVEEEAVPELEEHISEEEVEDVVEAVADAVEEAVSDVVEEMVEELADELVEEAIEAAEEAIVEAVEDALAEADEEISIEAMQQIVAEVVADAVEDAVEDILEEAAEEMEEAIAEAVEEAVTEAVEEVLEEEEAFDTPDEGRIPFSEELELPVEGLEDPIVEEAEEHSSYDPMSTQPVSSYEDLEAAAQERRNNMDSQLEAQRQQLFPDAESEEEAALVSESGPDPSELAQKARERLERHKQRRNEQSSSNDEAAPVALFDKLERARQLAAEARELLEEVHACSELVEDFFPTSLRELATQNDSDSHETMARREIRKLLELSETLGDVEANRLPSSSRKSMLRLARELQEEFEAGNAERSHHLGLQLANRMFDLIRRDLRPW